MKEKLALIFIIILLLVFIMLFSMYLVLVLRQDQNQQANLDNSQEDGFIYAVDSVASISEGLNSVPSDAFVESEADSFNKELEGF